MATEIRTQILESETFKNLCKTSQSVHSKNGAIKQVEDAIKIVHPYGVDVNSGCKNEQGVKDKEIPEPVVDDVVEIDDSNEDVVDVKDALDDLLDSEEKDKVTEITNFNFDI